MQFTVLRNEITLNLSFLGDIRLVLPNLSYRLSSSDDEPDVRHRILYSPFELWPENRRYDLVQSMISPNRPYAPLSDEFPKRANEHRVQFPRQLSYASHVFCHAPISTQLPSLSPVDRALVFHLPFFSEILSTLEFAELAETANFAETVELEESAEFEKNCRVCRTCKTSEIAEIELYKSFEANKNII